MNINKLYHIEHFDSFNNFYTIYKKLKSDSKFKYVPVYGHYYNNSNNFICKRIINKEIANISVLHDFIILNDSDLVRQYKGGIYKSNNIEYIYNIIDKIKTGELKNGAN